MNFNKFSYKGTDDEELDVTSFMNLMIVLVPVLLLSMTFTQVTVLDVKLPDLTGGIYNSDDSQSQLEVLVDESGFKIIYPTDVVIQEIPLRTEILASGEEVEVLDYRTLSSVLQGVKQQLPEKRDAVVTADAGVNYQSLISTMQTVKSYQTVVAANLVDVELFPEISLGDES
ncbi:ExbD/TolR family protein [Teredinibacter haidensis]|uniref:ExbD/TolR family protein n=1 Tax=Teredinibacter haidensis TaxID=2731755 RepID=UPI000948F7C8|nr:biopolymer transporter ExbD [Teredinibacter haidensis]